MLNRLPRTSRLGFAFSATLSVVWYSGFVAVAAAAAFLLSDPDELSTIAKVLPGGLLLAFLYWQVVPLLLVQMGSAIETRKLVAYPIPHSELFALEVLLRVSTGVEVLIVLTGAGIGLTLNPKLPWWAPAALLLFAVFNLLLSAGVRDLLQRLLAQKVIREIVVFLFVIAAALPQVMLLGGPGASLRHLVSKIPTVLWPWTATSQLAQNTQPAASFVGLLVWITGAYVFGRWQFERGLRFDEDEAQASSRPGAADSQTSPLEVFYRFPSHVFPDPLGALVEKELRLLSRSSRFRLVFLMGFSFGLLIWLPVAFGKAGAPGSWLSDNYLTLVGVYALLLLADVLFWNVFGFDRAATQMYFLAPVKTSTVLIGKNVAAFIFVLLEITAIGLTCGILGFPVTVTKLADAYLVALIVSLFMMSIGNLSSTYSPKPVDPTKSLRTGTSRQTQMLLMLLFPIVLSPVLLAYVARFAFANAMAFYGVLLLSAGLGALVYGISLESAVAAAHARSEEMIGALSRGAGLIEA
jgi:ABC-2 type transport system permease protein